MKKHICILASLVLALQSVIIAPGDELFEDWSVDEIDEYPEDAFAGVEALEGTAYEEADPGNQRDQTGSLPEDAPLIEDGTNAVIREGESLEKVWRIEEEAEEAARKVAELLAQEEIYLPAAQGDTLSAYLSQLRQLPSPTGSDGELLIGRYITQTMKDLGYTVTEQNFHEGFLNEDYVDVPGINIIAERGADAQERTRDIVLIVGHYDSKTLTDAGAPDQAETLSQEEASVQAQTPPQGETPKDAPQANPLENDKTSAAVMLECARILSGVESSVDLCFLFLSGEEDGHYGARHFVENLEEELRSRVRAVICLGPVGYVTEDSLLLPYLLNTGMGEENEPGNLLRAKALQHKAEQLLEAQTEGASVPDETQRLPKMETEEQSGKKAVYAVSTLQPESWSYVEPEGDPLKEEKADIQTQEGAEEGREDLSVSEGGTQKEDGVAGIFAAGRMPVVEVFQDAADCQEAGGQVWMQAGALVDFADILARTAAVYMQQGRTGIIEF